MCSKYIKAVCQTEVHFGRSCQVQPTGGSTAVHRLMRLEDLYEF